ncbi:MAG: alpha/beta hydrolase [Microcoleaceae cyanobacterium]
MKTQKSNLDWLTGVLAANAGSIRSTIQGVVCSIAAITCSALPSLAAERVYLSYASANISVSVDALDAYAEQQQTHPELDSYLLLLSAKDQEEFREVLHDSVHLDPRMVDRFFHSPTGEWVLNKLGDLIQSQSNEQGETTVENGSLAIRTALVRAAEDPEGLSLINILRHFPSEGIYLNTALMFELRNQIETLLKETDAVISEVVSLSQQEESRTGAVDFQQKPDLRQNGRYDVEMQTSILFDQSRNRRIPVDLYLPSPLKKAHLGQPNSIPIIVVSHGLGADRTSYTDFARHLASHGIAAALIQHPGSDTEKVQALLSGQAKEIFEVSEFIDRPKDISFLLDELEDRNPALYNNQLNLNQVGVVGHSFGAYTALAIGGAQIDYHNLELDCLSEFDSVNLARMFQCRALELPREEYDLRDPRVKAIMPINPVNSSIFGQQSISQLDLPILWKTSGKDNVTPVAWEQVRSFTWLKVPEKYLLLAEGDHHINLKLSSVNRAVSISLKEIIQPTPATVNSYVNALGLAFFQVYLMQDETYRAYLQPGYAKAISEDPYPLSLVRSITTEQFFKAIEQARVLVDE